MSHPFIKAMEMAIQQVEANFMARRGLPSPALVQEIKTTLTHSMRTALASEPEVLPRHKRRGTWHLENGAIVDFPKDRQGRTRFLRSNYNAGDVALLRQVVDMQRQTFTYEQTMSLKSKRKIDQAEIARVRRGI
jgi:hypothetical protein